VRALALTVALLLVLCASVAQAEVPQLVSYGAFQAEGPGITVNQSSGDVFTAGLFTCVEGCSFGAAVKRFDAEGGPIATLSSTSYYAAAAVNPVNDDVYVLNALGNIELYDKATGEVLSSFAVPPSGNLFSFTIVQIAADSSGDVYVPVIPENEVLEYSETGTLLNTFKGSGAGTLSEPSGVAVDSSGNLWVADTGNNRIEELSSSGTPLGEIKSDGVSSVAPGADGVIFATVFNGADFCGSLPSPCLHLVEYGPSGEQIADVGAGRFGERTSLIGFSPGNSMVAVNESSGQVYVTDTTSGLVAVFAPPRAPEVARELTANATGAEVELGALVNAGGLTAGYRFEYGTSSAYGHVMPLREGFATGTKAHAVWAAADGLTPGTTYHFRVVVHNAVGTVEGPDETFTTPAEAVCPNSAFRKGFSAGLPDCRAYEMVTQPNSISAQPDTTLGKGGEWGIPFSGGGFSGNHAARNGERFSYITKEPMPGSESAGMEYLATRDADGWSSEDVIPLQSYDNLFCSNPVWGNAIEAYSSQLTTGVLRVGANQLEGTSTKGEVPGGCGVEGLEVVQGEPPNFENLLLRDATGGYRLINAPPAGAIPTDAHFEGASADFSHVFFKENTRLTKDGPAGVEGLYEWDEGTLRLVSELPDGSAVAGSLASQWVMHPSVVSSDGSHVFFTAQGNLYLRIDGERTVQLDEPQGGPGPGGGGEFLKASADGTQAYFADDASAGLTADTVPGSGANLYRYANGQLTDLTAAEHAEVVDVLGVGAELVYFEAYGVLDSQANQGGETAKPGHLNVYERHGGTTTFIASGAQVSAVSPNGAFLAIVSTGRPTGYDNTDQNSGGPDPEIYLYSAASKQLACVSCAPSSEAPSAWSANGAQGGATLANVDILVQSGQFGGPSEGSPHYLSNDGRMVFQTEEALLPSDTNGQMDVYEYEEGQLHLISSGTADARQWLLDTGDELKDVFFLSRQPLVAQDSGGEGESNIIYDAREGGGFPASLSPPACTTAEACRAPAGAQPPIYGAPSSQTFAGAGNLTPAHKMSKRARKAKCNRGLAKKRSKCAKRRSRRTMKKSNHNKGSR
jgi:hypothetical protein